MLNERTSIFNNMRHIIRDMEQRSIVVFENSIKSEGTKKTYRHSLTKFKEYYKIKDFDSLLTISDEKVQVMLEDYLFYLKKKVSPNSIPTIMAGIELFFLMNRKTINTKILHKMYPPRVKVSGNKAWTTDNVAKCLQVSPSKRSRALIHFIASTGARVGAIDGLQLRHVTDMPNNCKAITLYEGTNEEYDSFLTPEASNALLEYLEERRRDGENLLPQNPVFRSIYRIGIQKIKPLSRVGAIGIISRSIKNAGLYRNKAGNRYEIQGDHGFRKRFATILKLRNDISYSVTERLLGHKQNLDSSYFRGTKDELFEEFKKAISDLIIDDSERNKITIAKLEAELSEKEKLNDEIQRLRQGVDYLLSKDPKAKKLLKS
ncbi:MAG: tyrosine-type recombinase/integrase [Nitrosopumilaceae archaeon]